MAALVLRIKFPPTYPLIYKTLRVDAKFTSKEAVKFIADTVNVTSLLQGSEGLYIPDEKRWLDDSTPLTAYESLQDVVRVFFELRFFLFCDPFFACFAVPVYISPCSMVYFDKNCSLDIILLGLLFRPLSVSRHWPFEISRDLSPRPFFAFLLFKYRIFALNILFSPPWYQFCTLDVLFWILIMT